MSQKNGPNEPKDSAMFNWANVLCVSNLTQLVLMIRQCRCILLSAAFAKSKKKPHSSRWAPGSSAIANVCHYRSGGEPFLIVSWCSVASSFSLSSSRTFSFFDSRALSQFTRYLHTVYAPISALLFSFLHEIFWKTINWIHSGWAFQKFPECLSSYINLPNTVPHHCHFELMVAVVVCCVPVVSGARRGRGGGFRRTLRFAPVLCEWSGANELVIMYDKKRRKGRGSAP